MKCFVPILLLLSFFCAAQKPLLYFEKLTVEHGLSHNKVNCIIQDRRGFIWIGTDDGLNRYDGKHFTHFRSRPGDSSSLSGNIVTDMLEDKDGRLWIATADGGMSRYDDRQPPAKKFRQYRNRPGNPGSIPANTINSLTEDAAGYLWLGTAGKNVLRFDKRSEQFIDVARSPKTVLDLSSDNNGMIWVGRQGGGIMKINTRNLAYVEDERYRDLYASLPHMTVTSLFKDGEGNMWYGSWDKVLYKYDIVTGRELVFQNKADLDFQNDEILCFAQDQRGRIWMGGKEKGLHIYDRGRFYNFRHDPTKGGSIADDRVNCLFIDRTGNIWLGTNRGVCINQPGRQQFAQHFLPVEPDNPVTIYDFYQDPEGLVWLGTSAGIFIRHQDGRMEHRPLKFKGASLQVSCFFVDGTDWYLGTNYSIFRYNPSANTIALLPNTHKDSVMNGIINSRVTSIIKHQINGHPVLMVSPYGHYLAYYDLKEQRWVSRLDSLNIVSRMRLKDFLIRKLYKSKDGQIWMGTSKEGLAVFDNAPFPQARFLNDDPAFATQLVANHVYDLVQDEKSNFWVSTFGGGLHYADLQKKTITPITATNNLAEGVQTDHHGQVWLISNGNLHRYDPFRKIYATYQLPDIEKTGGVRGKIFKDSKGHLYVAGTNYFIAFHPDSIADSRKVPTVYFTDFLIFNNSFSHLLQQKEIQLNYKDNFFSFEFAAPDYTSGSSLRYAYMLEGFDEDWVDAGERNYVSYSNLDGGTYTFKVRATNTPGNWGKEITTMRLIVIPPFWKTLPFYILCAALLALIIYIGYRYRINELLKRQAIRNKIAQDLHDNVGSTLSSISVYSQVAKIYQQKQKQSDLHQTLEKISTTSSEMISELNDTVWAINPRNDNMLVILQRMESFARPLLKAQNIEFHFRHDESLIHLNLQMEKRKNFYSIFKEAVNNAVKYAACSHLNVQVRQKGNRMLMTITDDGKGFDLSKTSEGYKSSDAFGGGNGLKNMQYRAKEMRGELSLHSAPGKGTRLELSFPIT
jgi:ligand-binding sensor domain-containing protein/two-component sensor histidine kinase